MHLLQLTQQTKLWLGGAIIYFHGRVTSFLKSRTPAAPQPFSGLQLFPPVWWKVTLEENSPYNVETFQGKRGRLTCGWVGSAGRCSWCGERPGLGGTRTRRLQRRGQDGAGGTRRRGWEESSEVQQRTEAACAPLLRTRRPGGGAGCRGVEDGALVSRTLESAWVVKNRLFY